MKTCRWTPYSKFRWIGREDYGVHPELGRTWVAAAPGLLRRRQHFGSNGNDFEMTLFSQQFLGFLGWPIFTFHFGLQAAEFKKVMVVVREEKHDIFSWWEVDSLSREARQKTDSLARAARKYDVPDPSDRRWDSGSEGQAVQSATSWNVALTLSIQWIRQSHRKDIQMFDEVFIAMTWIARLDRAASEAARQVQDAAERGETFFADGMWGRQIGTFIFCFILRWGEA